MTSFIIDLLMEKTDNNLFEPEVRRFARKIFTFTEISRSSYLSEALKNNIIGLQICLF